MILLCLLIALVLVTVVCWNMKMSKRLDIGHCWKKFRFDFHLALEGKEYEDGCREFLFEFRGYPKREGYLDLGLCLWIPFISLHVYWGDWAPTVVQDGCDCGDKEACSKCTK